MKRERNIWSDNHGESNFIPEYPDYSMFSLLRDTAQKYPDLDALDFQNKKITFSQMINALEDTARAFVAQGISKGDYVSVIAPNTPQALITIYALNRIGAIANMIHPLLSAAEIKRFVEKVDSVAVVTFDMLYPKLADIKWETTKQPLMILARIKDALPFYIKPLYSLKNRLKLGFNNQHNIIYWNSFIKSGKSSGVKLGADEGKGDDTAVVLYSGGTTGIPKGVMIHNRAFNCMAIQSSEIKPVDDASGMRCLAMMPTFHGFGLAMCMHVMLSFGTCAVLVPKFDFQAVSKLIFKKKINFIYAVPAMFEALSRTEEIEKEDLSFIKMIAFSGDRCSDKLLNRMNKYLEKGGSSARMTEAYGLTESLSGVCISPFFKMKKGSTGLPFPDNEIKICEIGTQNEVACGEDGEICVTGPTQMKGYFENETETSHALQVHADGKRWLHTGDIGCVDEEGYLYFRQRHCRMIITAGYNVYPTQIEDLIMKCAGVAQCCVIGAEDRVLGQKIIAFVQPVSMSADTEALREKITEQCKANLAEFSLPREIIFREKLPATAMGKVDFKVLMAEMKANGEVSVC